MECYNEIFIIWDSEVYHLTEKCIFNDDVMIRDAEWMLINVENTHFRRSEGYHLVFFGKKWIFKDDVMIRDTE